jgi:hypothetical protein
MALICESIIFKYNNEIFLDSQLRKVLKYEILKTKLANAKLAA